MIRISADPVLWATAREHLDVSAERVGFFLADWSPVESTFAVRSWRPIDDSATENRDILHVSLSDGTRSEVIQWAWAEGASLIEAHSHGSWTPAVFSRFDLSNLNEWVPHLWWRLGGRPYAAIVTSAFDFDGLAWISSPGDTEQVEGVSAGAFFRATGATRSRGRRSGDGRESL